MKILLDENLDPRLKEKIKSTIVTIQVHTVKEMNWLGLKNGELLKNAEHLKFDVFVSADKHIKNQQNLSFFKLNIIVMLLLKNDFPNQLSKITALIAVLERILEGKFVSGYFEI